ncbi:MAG: outer membrane protein transport protein [Pseudomonadota bacterium]|nr:outer membrane protein transport protein [Pseudomonadota bacterium]
MQTSRPLIRLSALALGIAGATAAGHVHASGFQLKENSVKSMGSAFSDTAVAEKDTSVVVNNPAAMTRFEGTSVQADLSVIDLSFRFEGGGTDISGQPLTGGDGGEAGDVAAVPAFSMVHKLDNGLALGAMVSAPFGLATEYEEGWVGRYFGQTSELQVIDLTLSAAVDIIPDRLSVGAGLTYSHADVTLSRAVDFGTILFGAGVPAPFARPQAADGRVDVQGDDTGLGWVAGILLRPSDRLSIGLSHRSEIDYDLSGEADWTVPATARAVFDAVGRGGLFRDGGASAQLTTPATTTLSIGYDVNDRLGLTASYTETGWESVQQVLIDFDNPEDANAVEDFSWDTTRFMAFGGEYRLNDAWTLRAGYAFDETPTTVETRTPRLPDEDRRWYSIGATWQYNPRVSLSFGYTRIEPDTPRIDIARPPSEGGHRLAGTYESAVNLFGVSAQYGF